MILMFHRQSREVSTPTQISGRIGRGTATERNQILRHRRACRTDEGAELADQVTVAINQRWQRKNAVSKRRAPKDSPAEAAIMEMVPATNVG